MWINLDAVLNEFLSFQNIQVFRLGKWVTGLQVGFFFVQVLRFQGHRQWGLDQVHDSIRDGQSNQESDEQAQ